MQTGHAIIDKSTCFLRYCECYEVLKYGLCSAMLHIINKLF